ncbi:MAG: lysoplasmalogenase [Actinobacteria bacterium]|nr:lysoplasmalogenase [Actinomycetota bacterium]
MTHTGAGGTRPVDLVEKPRGGWPVAPLVLLIIWALLLFGGFAFGSAVDDPTHRMPTWTRMASSLVLVAAGWAWFALSRSRSGRGDRGSRSDRDDRGVTRFSLFVALGMTAGLAGDLILAGLLPGGENVLAGIAAFGIGHVLYIAAILHWAGRRGFNRAGPRWVAFAVWWVVGAVAWCLVVLRGQEATVLHWAALPYALLLAGTCGAATGVAAQTRAFVPMAVGAALFLASDLILAAQLFNDLDFTLIGDVIWLTYGPGQMLIVYTNAVARRPIRASII